MRSQNLIYIAWILAIGFSTRGFALESPGARNPIGLGDVPPTAVRSGLVPSINPIDTSGNLVITGNVTGGMQFRGIVPYSSGTDFFTPTGTLANTSGGFDSFLKRTEGLQFSSQARGGLTPYYSPSMTVSKTIAGSGGMVTTRGVPSALRYEGQAILYDSGQAAYQRRFTPQFLNRPLAVNPMDVEKSIEADVSKYPLGGEQGSEGQLLENFWKQLGVRMTRKTEAQPEEAGQISGEEPNIGAYLEGVQIKRTDTLDRGLREQVGISELAGVGRPGVYEQMRIQLGKPVTTEEKAEGRKTRDEGRGAGPSTLRYSREGRLTAEGQAEPNAGGATEAGAAERVLDRYKSFAAYYDDKFNKNIRAAEYYMKQGKFYRAADAYTVATVYKPEDPLGYAGKSIALFATGEYMSSALFLARAIEIFPEYPTVRVDIVEVIGDKDTVENRIVEAREWLEKSRSGELAFLLSYVYYQMDRLEFARQTIEYAAKQIPDSPAIAAMKKAIDERLGKQ